MGCNCGYWWEDLNEYGEPISPAYCHYEGPDEWAPCVVSGYEGEPDNVWEDEAFWVHEFGQPYDYQEW